MTLGPYLFLNAALVGFFAFAAVYHLILWSSARRDILLVVFSADCAVRAAFSGVMFAIVTSKTTAEAAAAIHIRLALGILLMITWVWSLSLISRVKAPKFIWTVTVIFLILFPIHLFLRPLNPTIVSIDKFVLPWGEVAYRPRMGVPGWWVGPIYAVVISIELFGIYCGLRLWKRDRITGSLILLATSALLTLHVAHAVRAYARLDLPFLGMIGHIFWACTIGLVIARRNRQMEDDLRTSRRRLEVLSRQLITTQESERRHLARELHDEIGQMLTAIKMNLRFTQQAAGEKLQQQLQDNIAMVDLAISQVRNLSLSLRPLHLDELGLVAALHWLVKHQAEVGEFAEHLDIDLGGREISSDLATVCFRVAQEALTNAVRHGKPTNVYVKLWSCTDQLHLSIRDDGVGFDLQESELLALQGKSFGLAGMKERASLARGEITIESSANIGTTIHGSFPL